MAGHADSLKRGFQVMALPLLACQESVRHAFANLGPARPPQQNLNTISSAVALSLEKRTCLSMAKDTCQGAIRDRVLNKR
jgi:hypothetical protein